MKNTPNESQALLSLTEEARLLWRLRIRIVRTSIHQLLAGARLRTALVALLSVVFWIILFAVFWECFHIVQQTIAHEALRVQVVHAVFNLFFLALLVMITFSSAIISYSVLYRQEEVEFLVTTPIRSARLVLYKFQETTALSCWGFLLLSTPMLLAYGVVAGSPWYYYVLAIPFALSFVLIPAAVGTIICMLVIRYIPSARFHIIAWTAVALFAAAVAVGWFVFGGSRHDLMTATWFQTTLEQLKHSEQQLLPSWWLSSGLLEAAHPAHVSGHASSWHESLGFLAVLASNALLLQQAVQWVGAKCFLASYNRIADTGRRGRQAKLAWIDRAFVRAAILFPRTIRILLVKDLRLFRRDPVQWSQFLIFFALLALYFLNIRRFQYGQTLLLWVTSIGFLNLAVVGLILSTFTTRFIFPMISLEGRRIWILGSIPLAREQIVWSKFLFAVSVSIVPCASLILMSDAVLRILQRTPIIALIHQIACCALCTGLSALAVGLGARLPNLRETAPAKVAAGFGGTLTLILSAIYIIIVTSMTAVPCCVWVSRQRSMVSPEVPSDLWSRAALGTPEAVVVGMGATILLSVAVTVVSLRIGVRAFRDLEF